MRQENEFSHVLITLYVYKEEGENMRKIAFIVSPNLPFPVSRGGAVETLLQLFVDENEKTPKWDITVYSLYDAKSEELSKKYRYLKMKFLENKQNSLKSKARRFVNSALHIYPGFLNEYINDIVNDLRSSGKPDLCVVEGGNYRDYIPISHYIGRERMIMHIHAVSTPKLNANTIYGAFVFVSECAKKYWETKESSNNGVVLKNAIDETLFDNEIDKYEIDEHKRYLGYNPEDFVILYCGRLIEIKGVLELLKAVHSIADESVKLLIVGSSNFEGAEVTDYQKELLSYIDDRIKFTGYINNRDLPLYYQMADLVCSPSICQEAAPLVNIEAMMSGTPIISTRCGGIPEYSNPEGCLLIDYDGNNDHLTNVLSESIIELKGNRAKLNKMGASNKAFSKQFTKQKYFEDYSSIIESILRRIE